MHSCEQLLAPCIAIAERAGEAIMAYFGGALGTRCKDDKSPVTDADIAANTLIRNALLTLAPGIPVVAEEDEDITPPGQAVFWLVDPLDGTRSFVRGEPEFTVNIALIRNHDPVLGIICAPACGVLYWGSEGAGAYKRTGKNAPEAISARAAPADGLTVVCSKSHPSPAATAYLEQWRVKEKRPGSSSIKFCLIAEGSADLYPRFGRTMEWDTAAGHAILFAAGGRVETAQGQPLRYGKPHFENPHFIAFGLDFHN